MTRPIDPAAVTAALDAMNPVLEALPEGFVFVLCVAHRDRLDVGDCCAIVGNVPIEKVPALLQTVIDGAREQTAAPGVPS